MDKNVDKNVEQRTSVVVWFGLVCWLVGWLGLNASYDRTVWGALCPSNKSGLMNKQIVKTYRVWFGLAWFGANWWALFWSLEPQPRAQKKARLAEDAPARNAFWTVRNIPSIREYAFWDWAEYPAPNSRLDPGAARAAQRRLVTSR